MRVLACGGRGYDKEWIIHSMLDFMHAQRTITILINGGAKGADALALNWAKTNEIPFEIYEADWNGLGKAAGPQRNQKMIDCGKPDVVVAFPGGSGTADMVRRARKAGIEIVMVRYDNR